MIILDAPATWRPPDWHSDFGDIKGEFEHLKRLASAIVDGATGLMVALELPEPGLMFLSISRAGEPQAEVYSVQTRDAGMERRYGVFAFPDSPEESEDYALSVNEALALIERRLNGAPSA